MVFLMRQRTVHILFFVCLFGAGVQSASAGVWDTLSDSADVFELVSLDPGKKVGPEDGSFHGYYELGRTRIKVPQTRKQLLHSINTWMNVTNQAEGYLCFVPRHAIHTVKDGTTFDLLICFECRGYKAIISFDEKTRKIAKNAEKFVDAILTKNGIALAPKPCKEPAVAEKKGSSVENQ